MKKNIIIPSCLFSLIVVATVWNGSKTERTPAAIRGAEIEVEYEGELVAIADDMSPNPKNHRIEYFVKNKNTMTKIQLAQTPHESLLGQSVSFSGKTSAGSIPQGIIKPRTILRAKQVKHELAPPLNPPKMLVLLFKFSNSQTTYITPEQVHNEIFNGAFQNFFSTISEGRIQHMGTVKGWYPLNRTGNNGNPMICHVENDEVIAAASFYNINLQDYESVVMISNCSEYHTIGGRANLNPFDFLGIGKSQSYIKMASKPSILSIAGPDHPRLPGWRGLVPILVHERGHNFGFTHANGLDCGESQDLFPCEHVEYGNRFDRMGSGNGANTFNGHSQLANGWKKTTDFLHINEPGEYFVEKITTTAKNKKIGAYIYKKGSTDQKLFYVESRKAHGLDNNLLDPMFTRVTKGLLVYTNLGPSKVNMSPSRSAEMRIIDTNPTEATWDADTDYESLESEYADRQTGVVIRTVGETGNGVYFTVEYEDNLKVCGKSKLKQSISAPYIKLYEDNLLSRFKSKSTVEGLPSSSRDVRQKNIVLIPGDFFQLKIDTIFSEEMMCERKDFQIEGIMSEEFKSFKVLIGSPGPVGGEVGVARPVVGTSLGSDYKRYATNVAKAHEFPLLKIPASALGKTFSITFKTSGENESHNQTINIYVRSTHAPIVIAEEMKALY